MDKIQIPFVSAGEHSIGINLPTYATEEAAGLDLCAAISENIILEFGQRILIPTGYKMALPKGYEAQVRPRSGLALKNGVTVLNSPGTIDSDYRGEICVILINLGKDNFVIERNMRIAQMVVAKVAKAEIISPELVDELPDSARGEGGFGSTGS